MFSFNKQRAVQFQEEAAPEQPDYEVALMECLTHIAAGRKPNVAHVPPRLAPLLTTLADTIMRRDEETLSRTVGFSIQASEAMAATAKITDEVRTVSTGAQTMAAGVEQMTASISQIADNANQVADAMNHAVEETKVGTQAARQAATVISEASETFTRLASTIESLSEATQQIGQFTSIIEAIAKQTNLLALNATIEAARAGEAGRGFAVVANEVKSLSAQTQKATVDIGARVSHLSGQMQASLGEFEALKGMLQGGASAAYETSERIENIGQVVAANTARIDEMSVVLQQQSQAVSEISAGVDIIAVKSRASTRFAEEVIQSVAKSESLINEQFAELERRTIRNYVLHRAKSDHCLWKKRLSEMLVGLNQLKPGELNDHHECSLGKWYDLVQDNSMRAKHSFKELEGPHALVHNHGRKAVELFAQGRKEEAVREISAMEKASVDVLRLLDDMLRDGGTGA